VKALAVEPLLGGPLVSGATVGSARGLAGTGGHWDEYWHLRHWVAQGYEL
jgi:hypothetical protein